MAPPLPAVCWGAGLLHVTLHGHRWDAHHLWCPTFHQCKALPGALSIEVYGSYGICLWVTSIESCTKYWQERVGGLCFRGWSFSLGVPNPFSSDITPALPPIQQLMFLAEEYVECESGAHLLFTYLLRACSHDRFFCLTQIHRLSPGSGGVCHFFRHEFSPFPDTVTTEFRGTGL